MSSHARPSLQNVFCKNGINGTDRTVNKIQAGVGCCICCPQHRHEALTDRHLASRQRRSQPMPATGGHAGAPNCSRPSFYHPSLDASTHEIGPLPAARVRPHACLYAPVGVVRPALKTNMCLYGNAGLLFSDTEPKAPLDTCKENQIVAASNVAGRPENSNASASPAATSTLSALLVADSHPPSRMKHSATAASGSMAAAPQAATWVLSAGFTPTWHQG